MTTSPTFGGEKGLQGGALDRPWCRMSFCQDGQEANALDAICDYLKRPRALSGVDVVRMHASTENSWRRLGMTTGVKTKIQPTRPLLLRH